MLQLVQGRVEGQVVLVVTDLTVQLKQTDGQVLVRVAGRDQKPRAGAQVQRVPAPGKGPAGTTDDKGEVTLAVQRAAPPRHRRVGRGHGASWTRTSTRRWRWRRTCSSTATAPSTSRATR